MIFPTYTLKNAKRWEKKLLDFGKDIVPKSTKQAIRKFVRKELLPRIKSKLGSLPITPVIKIKARKGIKAGLILLVGVRKQLHLVRWLAFGTQARTTRSGAYRGSIRRRVSPSFIQDLRDANVEKFKTLVAQALQQEIKKL